MVSCVEGGESGKVGIPECVHVYRSNCSILKGPRNFKMPKKLLTSDFMLGKFWKSTTCCIHHTLLLT